MRDLLVLTVEPKLGKEEALRRVEPALSKASEGFPSLKVEEELWSGDRMDFRVRALGQVTAGNAQKAEDPRAPRSDVAVAAAKLRRRRAEDYQQARADPRVEVACFPIGTARLHLALMKR